MHDIMHATKHNTMHIMHAWHLHNMHACHLHNTMHNIHAQHNKHSVFSIQSTPAAACMVPQVLQRSVAEEVEAVGVIVPAVHTAHPEHAIAWL